MQNKILFDNYYLGENVSYKELSDRGISELFNTLTHKYCVQKAALETGLFNDDEINILVDYCMEPDMVDTGPDRHWKHFYDVSSGFGGAPSMAEKKYMEAVNNKDLRALSNSSHYVADAGCLFHTTLRGQNLHIPYEEWIDENIDKITHYIQSIYDYDYDNIKKLAIELAIRTYDRYDIIVDNFINNNHTELSIETADNLSDVISSMKNLFENYYYDVENGVTYDVPFVPSLEMLLFLPFALCVPLIVTNS